MKNLFFIVLLLGFSFSSAKHFKIHKPRSNQCALVEGTLIKYKNNPALFTFQKASHHTKSGRYQMSHTYFYIQTPDKKTVKVVLDNLFYNNLSENQATNKKNVDIINDLQSKYHEGDAVSACGKFFNDKKMHMKGIHFIHPSSCENYQFEGYLKINQAAISNNAQYCANCECNIKSK